MGTSKQPDSGPSRFWSRLPLYVQIGFALIVLFAMVGNCAGHSESSAVVFILVATVWACTKIMLEAIEAVRILSMDSSLSKPSDKDPPAA